LWSESDQSPTQVVDGDFDLNEEPTIKSLRIQTIYLYSSNLSYLL